MPLYLSVPYRDKDIVKALGARWDGERRQWFAPDGAPPERFARWAGLGVGAPSSAAVAKVQATPTPDGAKGAVSLSSLLFDAAEAVRRALPQAKWILAEVASVKSNKTSGHSYFELVEHDAEGREVAKASARLWASNLRVLRTFEKANGGPIEAGMKILALAQADLSVQ